MVTVSLADFELILTQQLSLTHLFNYLTRLSFRLTHTLAFRLKSHRTHHIYRVSQNWKHLGLREILSLLLSLRVFFYTQFSWCELRDFGSIKYIRAKIPPRR